MDEINRHNHNEMQNIKWINFPYWQICLAFDEKALMHFFSSAPSTFIYFCLLIFSSNEQIMEEMWWNDINCVCINGIKHLEIEFRLEDRTLNACHFMNASTLFHWMVCFHPSSVLQCAYFYRSWFRFTYG